MTFCDSFPQTRPIWYTPQMSLLALSNDEDVPGHEHSNLACLRLARFFSGLPDDEIAPFFKAAQARAYKKGKVLYLEGEAADFFYVICSGWIKLFHTMPEGDEIIIDMLTNGHLVGESALFEKGIHTSSAEIVEDVYLLSIPLRILKEQIAKSQTMALGMLSSLSYHHRRHFGEIALNATQNAPQRIGCFLLRLCPRNQMQDFIFHLPYDKTLIANTLGMNGATFSRALNLLRQKTGLRIKGTRVEIDSIDKLVKFVYGPLAMDHSRDDGTERRKQGAD